MSSTLVDLPIIGSAVAVAHKFLGDFGITGWLADAMEFVLLLGLGIIGLWFVFHRVLPTLAVALAQVLVGLLHVVHFVFLLPQMAVTTRHDRRGSVPGPLVYAYGDGIERFCTTSIAAVKARTAGLKNIRPIPKKWFVILLLGLFAWRNWSYCRGAAPTCVSPIEHWTGSFSAWWKSKK